MKQKILLHVCCAICGAALTELLKDKYDVVILFYNPNIHPKEEYEKRKDSVKKLAEIYNLQFIEGEYDDKNWFELVKGLEQEPEGGARCPVCFKMRLEKTGQVAKENNCTGFLTTLAMSPYKNENQINEIALRLASLTQGKAKFLTLKDLGIDKKQIWQKSRELARKYEFYHQKYCGCVYSIRN